MVYINKRFTKHIIEESRNRSNEVVKKERNRYKMEKRKQHRTEHRRGLQRKKYGLSVCVRER